MATADRGREILHWDGQRLYVLFWYFSCSEGTDLGCVELSICGEYVPELPQIPLWVEC